MEQGGPKAPKGLAGSDATTKGPKPAPNPQRDPLLVDQLQTLPPPSAATAQTLDALSDLMAAKVARELRGGPIGAAKGTSQTNGGYAGYVPLWGGGY